MPSLIVDGELILAGPVRTGEYGWLFDTGFSSGDVIEALAKFGADAVTVRLNSPGGFPVEAEAIRAAFERHAGDVTLVVEGMAASAASLLAMGATTIEMSRGSIMMIHDPSTCVCGTSEDLQHGSDMLETMAAGYASVYAARAGISDDDARAIMRDEVFYTAEAAVEAGFADRVSDRSAVAPVEESEARMAVASLQGGMRTASAIMQGTTPVASGTLAQEVQPSLSGIQMSQTTSVQPNQNDNAPAPDGAQTQEGQMPKNESATPGAGSAGNTASVTEVQQRAMMAERQRAAGIREAAQPFLGASLSEEDVTRIVDSGVTVEVAASQMMTLMANHTQQRPSSIKITRDETDTRCEGMIAALAGDFEKEGAQFRGLRLKSLALELAGERRGFNESHHLRQGMSATRMMGGAHGVSDFAYVTGEAMRRRLQSEMQQRDPVWRAVTGEPVDAVDFREMTLVRAGGDFELKRVKENGEYEETVLADNGEKLSVIRKGRKITITFEAVINDDLRVFDRLPRDYARAARNAEESAVWSIIRSNVKMSSDNKALFHADHKNLASTGAAISVTSVQEGRKAMWEQKALGTVQKDAFMMVSPDRLIVPPSLESTAGQFVAQITPRQTSDVNPYSQTLTPYTVPHLGEAAGGSDTAWYLVSSDLPPIATAYLEGYQGLDITTPQTTDPYNVTMVAHHIFGAAAEEYRGAYKNAGE